MPRASWLDERGAAAVEFAIVLPVLLLIVMGTLEWGRYFVVREGVVHSAREGARGGTLMDATMADACAAAHAYLSTMGISAACGSGITVDMDHYIAGGSDDIPAVQVQIDVPFQTLTGLPLFVPTTMHVEAVMPSWRPISEG
jgi:Flp pilus assembly protein TadG